MKGLRGGSGWSLGLGKGKGRPFNPLTDYDWYVDSSIGSSGDGTTAATAFKTPEEAATACASGDTIAFKRGTTSRGLFNAGAKDNLTLLAYGSGTLPIVTAYDVHSGAWALLGGTTNVWQTSVTPELDATPNYRITARKNGTPMEMRTSTTEVDASPPVNDNPGGCYSPDLDGSTGTYTVSIYATADPGADGQTYEMAVRQSTVIVGDGCTIQNLRLIGSTGKDGPLSMGDSSLVEDCVIEDGRWHNAVISSGTCRRCDFLHMENAALSSNSMLTFFKGTVTTETWLADDCLFMLKFNPADGYVRTNGMPIFNHTSDASRYVTGTVRNSKTLWMTNGFRFSGADALVGSNLISARLSRTGASVPECFAVEGNGDTCTLSHIRAYGNETGFKATALFISSVSGMEDHTQVTNSLLEGSLDAAIAVRVQADCRFTNVIVRGGLFQAIADQGLAAAQVSLSKVIFDGPIAAALELTHASSTLVASDNNQVDNTNLDWIYEGSTYADLAAQQANGFDLNSVATPDPAYASDYSGNAEPIGTWTADGDKGPDTSLFDDYTESIDAAAILAVVLAK